MSISSNSCPTRAPIVPRVLRTADSADFFDAARSSRMLLRRCTVCGLVRGPQVRWCPDCHAEGHEAIFATGDATLVSWAVVHRAPVPELQPDTPLVAAIVELVEGAWLLTRVLTPPGETLCTGMALRLVFRTSTAAAEDPGETLVFAATAASTSTAPSS